nr:hypothetical protein [Paenibacillus sp. F411]
MNRQMDTMLLWEGTTRQRFYADFDRARLDLKRVIELMESVSVELKGISIKFRLLDEEVSSKIASSGRSEAPPEPKTWKDHAEGLWEGVKTGGKNIANSIVDTGEALIEDPLGTIGDMAYNATIGTVEEVIDTTFWGTKMAFDVGDTREKFEESVNAAGGTSQFIGQQGAMIASNLIFGRIGLKNRHDSGAEGGDDSKATEHSLPDENKPKGNYTRGDSHGVKKENESADLLAAQGYNIEMLDEVNGGNGYGIKETSNPDFLIEGKVYDCYAPTTDANVDNILRNIRTKTKTQVENIVLNLDNFTEERINEITEGIARKSDGDLKNLQELLIVVDGRITHVVGGK